MHQIYITAILTTIVSALVWGGFVLRKTSKNEKKLIVALLVLQLPISFLVLYYLRTPWTNFMVAHLGKDSPYILIEKLFEAPVMEELFKLWPLLIPFFWKKVTKENALKLGLALGIGFGIGEIWTIANMVAANAAYASYPWYIFTGFISERFITVFLHGSITGLGLHLIKNRSKLWIWVPMTLHFALNAPIFLQIIDFGGMIAKNPDLGKYIWGAFLSAWIVIFAVVMMNVLFARKLMKEKTTFANILCGKGETCPHCKKKYAHPAWIINLFFVQYKKCPYCGKWEKFNFFKNSLKV